MLLRVREGSLSSPLFFIFLAKSETHIRAKEKEKAVSVLLKVFAQMYQVTLDINLINMTPVSAAVIV